VNRRQFLLNLASAGLGAVVCRQGFAQSDLPINDKSAPARLTIDETATSHVIPLNYTGLSYELAQLSDPDFFAPTNDDLIAFFRLMSPSGVLRLGGNTSEFCWFASDDSVTAPILQPPAGNNVENWMPHQQFRITPEAINRLADFLSATGWSLIYGLNLGHGYPDRAAVEADYVTQTIGSRLLYFQIGNEPNLYRESYNRLRPPTWKYADYFSQWIQFAGAVTQRVPQARFAGPDVAGDSDWVQRFAADAPSRLGSRLASLTSHHYPMGPPTDPTVTIQRLLKTNPHVAQWVSATVELATKIGAQYRMTEGNSCYRGGKPGLSDTLASALWAADYMLSLAAVGCHGVNFHGGGGGYLRAALGGQLPGEQTIKTLKPVKNAFYSPIAGYIGEGFSARPEFYGILLANQFAGSSVVASDLNANGINATAYAARTNNTLRVALFNKSKDQDLNLQLQTRSIYNDPKVWRLSAPALDATSGVSLAGAQISPRAQWSPISSEKPRGVPQGYWLDLPRASAALVILD
jgi:hypothetical protein